MDWEKDFSISNHSGMRVIYGSVDIPDGTDSYIMECYRYGDETIAMIKSYVKRGILKATNDFKVPTKSKIGAESNGVERVQSVASDAGDKHNHFVYNPYRDSNSAIKVESIDMGGKSIEVNEDLTSDDNRGIVVTEQRIVADDKISKEDAIGILNLQWKKFESEINKIDDLRKLNFLEIVAIEIGASDKKKQIIQDRISKI